jgi:hypothetical protein
MQTTRILCMKCCALYMEIPRRQEPYIKPWMSSSRAKGSTLSDLRNLCGKGLAVGNMLKTSMCELTWMTVLLHVNQRTLWPLSRRKYYCDSHGSQVLMKERLPNTLDAS